MTSTQKRQVVKFAQNMPVEVGTEGRDAGEVISTKAGEHVYSARDSDGAGVGLERSAQRFGRRFELKALAEIASTLLRAAADRTIKVAIEAGVEIPGATLIPENVIGQEEARNVKSKKEQWSNDDHVGRGLRRIARRRVAIQSWKPYDYADMLVNPQRNSPTNESGGLNQRGIVQYAELVSISVFPSSQAGQILFDCLLARVKNQQDHPAKSTTAYYPANV